MIYRPDMIHGKKEIHQKLAAAIAQFWGLYSTVWLVKFKSGGLTTTSSFSYAPD